MPKRKILYETLEEAVEQTHVPTEANGICHGFFAPSSGPQPCQVSFPQALRSEFVARDAHAELKQMLELGVAEGSIRCATPPHSPRAAAQSTGAPRAPRKPV
jgi:hypothetical protein